MPYKRLSWKGGGGLTLVHDSPIPGITWRQFKAARKWIKKHKKELGGMSVHRALQFESRVRVLARLLQPRKHWW